MSQISTSSIQGIADSMGIPLNKQPLVTILAEEVEKSLNQIIRESGLLMRNFRTSKLLPKHINMVLSSKCMIPLLGYSNCPSFLLQSVWHEQTGLTFAKDPIVDLSTVVNNSSYPFPRSAPFGFQWLLVEGVPPENCTQTRKPTIRLIRSNYNEIDSSCSDQSEILRPSLVDTSSKTFSSRHFVGDVLNPELQADFVKTINMLRDDTSYTSVKALYFLRNEEGIQPLLPYFLQFIFGEITLHYNDIVLMELIIGVSNSLIGNNNLCVSLYAHSFIRIAFSVLLGQDSASFSVDEDCDLREKAASLLETTCERCSDGYPQISVSSFNALIHKLFDYRTTLAAQYGALCGISSLGTGSVERVLTHMPSYCRLLAIERNIGSRRQCAFIQRIKAKIHDMIRIYLLKTSKADSRIIEQIEFIIGG